MANFDEAFGRISRNQGGYYPEDGDDESDETYKGISRRFHPSWGGWVIVDALRRAASNENELRRTLDQNERLKKEVRFFFKQIYWDRFAGDRIPDQRIADELFDTSLNLGVHRAVCFLQESLNLLSGYREKHGSIPEDGRFGPMTLETLETYLKAEDSLDLLKVMNVLEGMHYIGYLRKQPLQEDFARKFLKRIKISKDMVAMKPPAPPTDFRIE